MRQQKMNQRCFRVAISPWVDEIGSWRTVLTNHELGGRCHESASFLSTAIEDHTVSVLGSLNLFRFRFQGTINAKDPQPP